MKKITLFIILMSFSLGFAQPNTNAPNPTNNPSDVISVYSDYFVTNVATNYNPNWGQSGICCVNPSYNPGSGNLVMAYANFNYQGTELTTQNAAGMEFLHVDVWTNANPGTTTLQVSPINNGTGASETLVTINYTQGSWYSVNIPKSAFTGMTWDSVFQMKFAANGPGSTVPVDIYLDNIYFWKTATPPGSDATLSNLQVDGSTINGFSSAATAYNYEVVVGTTAIPQITLATTTDPLATITSITQANAIPGTATVLVTSQNGNVTKTYTVAIAATLPNESPTPSTPNSEVLNIYSDTPGYTNNWVPDYSFGGFAAIQDLNQGTGVNNAIKMNFAVQGYGQGTGGVTDISNYNYLHFDYFADSNSTQIRFIVIGNNGGVNEYPYELTTAGSNGTLVQGSWQSVNVPLSFFQGAGFNKSTFFQYKLGTTSDLVSDIVYFDNIYFSVNPGTILNNSTFNSNTFSAYPNPSQNEWNISSKQDINSIQLFDVTGKKVLEINPNSMNAKIDASVLSNGLYFANIYTNEGSKTIKLIKN